MRALIQRVSQAQVDVEEETVGKIGAGVLILICAMQGDSEADGQKLAEKISKLRIFKDEDGRMNRSVLDIEGQALVVSQFTLAADTRRGNRPGFSRAAAPDLGRALYDNFTEQLQTIGISCETGRFGADMQVRLVNDGPVTIWIDTSD